jgi:hypothetical protein
LPNGPALSLSNGPALSLSNGRAARIARRLKALAPREVAMVFDRRRLHPGRCEICEKVAEDLRPYGRGGRWACFACADREPDVMDARMAWFLFGVKLEEEM